MSTNLKSASRLERLVERGVRFASAGRIAEALQCYAQVCSETATNDQELLQVVRAWVNQGVLADRQGETSQAIQAWDRGWKLSQENSGSARIQAAGFQGLIFVALRSPLVSRSKLLRPAVDQALSRNWPEVHVLIWNLFAGDPDLPLGEALPQDSGLEAQNPGLGVWTRLFFAPQLSLPGQRPSVSDFAGFYQALAPRLRPRLWQNQGTQPWCVELFNSSWAPKPPTAWELSWLRKKKAQDWVPQLEKNWPSRGVRSPVRGLEPWKDSWTWVCENGEIRLGKTSKHTTLVNRLEAEVLQARGTPPFWHLFLARPSRWGRVEISVPDSFRCVEGPWEGLAEAPEGTWAWDTEGQVFFWGNSEKEPQKRGFAGKGPWDTGWAQGGWGLVLGGRDGRLWRLRLDGKIEENKVHQGPVTLLLGEENRLVSAGEDSLAFVWSQALGLSKSLSLQNLPGPARFGAAHRGRTALAGLDFSMVYDGENWTPGPAFSKPSALGLAPSGELLAAETRGRILVGDQALWGWSDWPTFLKTHPQKQEWAAGALDGSVRIVEGAEIRSLGFEPVLAWKGSENAVWALSPFRLERWDNEGPLVLDGPRQGSGWTAQASNAEGWFLGDWSGQIEFLDWKERRREPVERLGSPLVALYAEDEAFWCVTRKGIFYHFRRKGTGSWKQEASFAWGRGPVSGALWSKTGLVLVWGPSSSPCLVLDTLQGGRPLTVFEPTGGLSAASWQGELLWLAEGRGRLAVWDVRDARMKQELLDSGEKVRQILPQERCLALVFEGRRPGLVTLGGVSEFMTLGAHRRAVTSGALTPGGEEFWSAAEDGVIRRFRLPGGELLGKIETPGEITEHIAFWDQGRRFALRLRSGGVITGSREQGETPR
jgi:hypothetical protein